MVIVISSDLLGIVYVHRDDDAISGVYPAQDFKDERKSSVSYESILATFHGAYSNHFVKKENFTLISDVRIRYNMCSCDRYRL